MKIIEIVDIDKESGKFFKSILKLFGLIFLGTFLFAIVNDVGNLEIDSSRASGVIFGLILGMYVGMCVQKTGGLKRGKKNE